MQSPDAAASSSVWPSSQRLVGCCWWCWSRGIGVWHVHHRSVFGLEMMMWGRNCLQSFPKQLSATRRCPVRHTVHCLQHKSESNKVHNDCVVFIHLHKMPSRHVIKMWHMFPVYSGPISRQLSTSPRIVDAHLGSEKSYDIIIPQFVELFVSTVVLFSVWIFSVWCQCKHNIKHLLTGQPLRTGMRVCAIWKQ